MTVAEKLTAIAENEPKVYVSGLQEASEKFWNDLTNNGERTDFQYVFTHWGGEYFRPTRKIVPITAGSASSLFHSARRLKKLESGYLDFSQKTRGTSNMQGFYYTFYNCIELEEVADIGMQADHSYTHTFSNCSKLRKVAKIRCDENTLFTSTFHYCYALEEVFFEGVIGQNGLNLQWSTKLSKPSIESIINALSESTSGLTLTLSLTAVNNAFGYVEDGDNYEWETLTGSRSNWTIALV